MTIQTVTGFAAPTRITHWHDCRTCNRAYACHTHARFEINCTTLRTCSLCATRRAHEPGLADGHIAPRSPVYAAAIG